MVHAKVESVICDGCGEDVPPDYSSRPSREEQRRGQVDDAPSEF